MDEQSQRNAFAANFLETLGTTLDWPPTLAEGDFAGPWSVAPHGDAEWAVRRPGDPRPYLLTTRWETACMLAAVLPANGRSPAYTLRPAENRGSDLCVLAGTELQPIGHLPTADRDTLDALNVAHSLLVSPISLAHLLIAAPADVLKRTGVIMAKLLAEKAEQVEAVAAGHGD